MKKKGKLLFEKPADGNYKVFLYREVDRGKKELKGFVNAESWVHLHDQPCEYIKIGKQIEVFVKGKTLYNNKKPADTPVYKKPPPATIKKAPIQERSNRRGQHRAQDRNQSHHGNNPQKIIDSFLLSKAKVPADTKRTNVRAEEVENFSLKLNQFARHEENDRDKSKSKFQFFKSGRRGVEYQIKSHFGIEEQDFKELAQRLSTSAKVICGEQTEIFQQKTAGRFITGLGEASVYETNITLHHVHGFPYVPATSLKGIVRSWIIQSYFGTTDIPESEKDNPLVNAEYRAYQNKDFCIIFGCPATVIKADSKIKMDVALTNPTTGKGQEHQGSVIFFDVMPVNEPSIVPDIMNVHYQDYYGKGKAPTDYLSPNPIPFLTVQDTSFQFILGSKKAEWLNWKIGEKNIVEWTKEALQNHGIGAKTAVGYGYME